MLINFIVQQNCPIIMPQTKYTKGIKCKKGGANLPLKGEMRPYLCASETNELIK